MAIARACRTLAKYAMRLSEQQRETWEWKMCCRHLVSPWQRAYVELQPPEIGPVVVLPQLGGLHHRYERRAA